MNGNANPIQQIADLFGGQTAMGRALKKPQQTVWEWINAKRVPSRHIPAIIAAAERLQPAVHLRADHFFGLEQVPARSEAA